MLLFNLNNKIMYTLYKLQEGFIVTSDETTKYGDFVWNGEHILEVAKVFHPIGQKVIAQQHQIDFSALSEEEQKEIGWLDVEKLAEQFVVSKVKMSSQAAGVLVGFIEGFQKAQELLSDRSFTEEDLKDASIMYAQWLIGGTPSLRVAQNPEERFKQIIESLSQPKSWSVEGEWNENKFNVLKINEQ
jgi:hypothetical protein